MHPIKQKLHAYCLKFLSDRLSAIDKIMDDCQRAANSETKTTAGDKHETNRAMMQLDRENHAVQRVATLHGLAKLRAIDLNQEHEEAELGAVIRSDKGSFFLAISAGKTMIDDELFYIISIDSPIGQALLGAEQEDIIFFRDREYDILDVF